MYVLHCSCCGCVIFFLFINSSSSISDLCRLVQQVHRQSGSIIIICSIRYTSAQAITASKVENIIIIRIFELSTGLYYVYNDHRHIKTIDIFVRVCVYFEYIVLHYNVFYFLPFLSFVRSSIFNFTHHACVLSQLCALALTRSSSSLDLIGQVVFLLCNQIQKIHFPFDWCFLPVSLCKWPTIHFGFTYIINEYCIYIGWFVCVCVCAYICWQWHSNYNPLDRHKSKITYIFFLLFSRSFFFVHIVCVCICVCRLNNKLIKDFSCVSNVLLRLDL